MKAVDLAVIATPAAAVPAMIVQCVQRGVQAAIVISAGFSELGAAGRALEKEIKEIALGKMRIIGPNCLGVIHPPSNLNASFAASMARPADNRGPTRFRRRSTSAGRTCRRASPRCAIPRSRWRSG